MTLPFRRRHHDAESGHDRARSLMSESLVAPLAPDEDAWLTRHLEGCGECGRDLAAYRADRELLRDLREQPLQPPRDLWARTSAALDREARRLGRPTTAEPAQQGRGGLGWRAFPLGAVAGALVVAVLIGTRVFDGRTPPDASVPASDVAVLPSPEPTNLIVDADPVAIFRETDFGSWELVYNEVDEFCPPDKRGCVPQQGGEPHAVDLGERPAKVALSNGQLAIASDPDAGNPGRVLVVPVVSGPGASPLPSVIVTPPPPTDAPPTDAPTPVESSPAPTATAAPTPPGAIAIATGVRVVGDVAYSGDGRWLAFSAEPSDGSTGPDLYLWEVGEPEAVVVTDDHRTYFSSWHDGQVLASRVELADEPGDPTASPDPGASLEPGGSADPTESRGPGRGQGNGNGGGGSRGSGAQASSEPSAAPATPEPSTVPAGGDGPAAIEGRPVSFLLDPESGDRTDLTAADVWLPVLDPDGRFVVYWSGTLRSQDGEDWALGTGELVLDTWAAALAPDPDPAPEATPAAPTGEEQTPGAPGDQPSSPSPDPSSATPPRGAAGLPATLVPGDKAVFEASFDPTSRRLAIWIGEAVDEEVGRLYLLVLDPDTGAIADESPLTETPALRRFSIDKGRLAWVTPSGQDGQESAVQVLGWDGDDFGEIRTEPAADLYLP